MSNEQTNLFGFLYQNFKFTKPIRLIELFAGYGSQAMCFKKLQQESSLKFEHYKVVEFDKYAIRSYNAVNMTNYETLDIRNISANDLEIVDMDKYDYVMTYSFPCQDLSKAGKGRGMSKGNNTRSGLLWEVERILGECYRDDCLPQLLLMENVPDVIGTKNYADFKKWYASLEACGYQSYYTTLNAKNCGVPQNRDRCFMISILGDYNYTFPKPFKLKMRLKDVLEKDVDEKYYLSDKMLQGMKNTKFNTYSYENCVRDLDGVARTVLSRFESAPQCVIVNGLTRKLTPRECGRLMGVNDEDITKMLEVNSNSQCYKQFGNSIVVDVLYYIFKQMC